MPDAHIKAKLPTLKTAARFWSRVNKDGPTMRPELGPCWEWIAGKGRDGYGSIRSKGKSVGAHRVSWEIHNGPILGGLLVCHKCDNPPCVNPDHLFLGTQRDNAKDSVAKGRWSGNIILNEQQVREIRRRYNPKTTSYAKLGAEYGVGYGAVNHIIHRRTWSNLLDEE